jgi:toxin ParE1/3/4
LTTVVFTPAAESDVSEAIDWYEEHAPGLGARLLSELDDVVLRIEENPRQFPLMHRDARRALLRRFPYAIFFRLAGTEAQILACFHTSRDPSTWQERV